MLSIFFAAVSVAAVVIGVAGLTTMGFGLVRLAAAARTRRWPHVPGTVLSSTVEEKAEDHVFHAKVTYRYTVGGKDFEGSRIAFDELETSNRSPAVERAARFPGGASVEVFYEPTSPQDSVLEPGVSGASAIPLAVGAGLVFLGLSMFAIAWKLSGR